MKATLFTLFAVGGFLATSIASPLAVEKRQDIDAIETSLETLLTQIQEQTELISK